MEKENRSARTGTVMQQVRMLKGATNQMGSHLPLALGIISCFCRHAERDSARKVKTSIEIDGGSVKTHQRVEWAGQHQAYQRIWGARRLYEVPGAWLAPPWPWACWAAIWDCHQSAM